MSFVSHAQNFEDVMLWRALKQVENGFYVDVGANDPEVHSVTKAFYDRGWRGINIEPVPQWYDKLAAERQNDVNLQLAAGARSGEMVLYEIPDTGLSTSSGAIASRHEADGYNHIERIVAVETLTEICRKFHLAPIHFLKIDVEGAEKQVLEGLDLDLVRPWIIVVESTLPLTHAESHAEWEPILADAGYTFVYFDGLNRFYVEGEHADLLAHFKTPPSVFDEFVPAAQAAAERSLIAMTKVLEQRAESAEARADEQEQRAKLAETLAHSHEARAVAAEQRLEQLVQRALAAEELAQRHAARAITAENYAQALLSSSSWRITAPVRFIVESARRSSTIVAKVLGRKADRPTHQRGTDQPGAATAGRAGTETLSPHVSEVYTELQAALARRQKTPD
jgi:FkbM family methyltransferase